MGIDLEGNVYTSVVDADQREILNAGFQQPKTDLVLRNNGTLVTEYGTLWEAEIDENHGDNTPVYPANAECTHTQSLGPNWYLSSPLNSLHEEIESSLCSKNKEYRLSLRYQTDTGETVGRLALLKRIENSDPASYAVVWEPDQNCDLTGSCYLGMLSNGHLELRTQIIPSDDSIVWTTNTMDNDGADLQGARLRLRNNGKLAVEFGPFWRAETHEGEVIPDNATINTNRQACETHRHQNPTEIAVGSTTPDDPILCSRNGKYRLFYYTEESATNPQLLLVERRGGDFYKIWSHALHVWNAAILDAPEGTQLVLKNNGVLSLEYGAFWTANEEQAAY